jgi:ACS family hexuronate transporter-like MFS transporter
MAGAVGGILLAELAGHLIEYTGSYVPLFCVCALAYLVAWMMFRVLTNTTT